MNINEAIISAGDFDGHVSDIDMPAGIVHVMFGSVVDAAGWRSSHKLEGKADFATPLKSFGHVVILKVQVSRPALLGYVNAGYVITDVITEPSVSGNDRYYVIGTRKETGHSARYVTWACHFADFDNDWTFYWGHYKETLPEARRDLAERSALVPAK